MLKNKLFYTVLFIFVLLFAVFTIESSAFVYEYEGNVFNFGNIDDEMLEYRCIWVNGYDVVLITCDSEPYVYYNSRDSMSGYSLGASTSFRSFYYDCRFHKTISLTERYVGLPASFAEIFVESNFDILDTDGNLVFQAPVQEITLGTVLEKANPVETFQTMTHGMITYLLVFLIGLVAFWKAWSFLSKNLRKA